MEAAPEPVVYTDDEMELDEELEAVARYEQACRLAALATALSGGLSHA